MLQARGRGIMNYLNRFAAVRPPDAMGGLSQGGPREYGDYWFLYKMVRKRKPRIIWEFGSDNSTIILAKALFDNGYGFLYSMDAIEKWSQSTRDSIPVELRRFCQVIYSPVEEVTYNGTPGFRHSILPKIIPNFAYLDGPPLTPERQVAIDLLEIENQLPDDFFLVIDDRKTNTRFLNEHLKRQYVFRSRVRHVQPVFELVR